MCYWNVPVKYPSTVILYVNFLLKFSTAVWSFVVVHLMFPIEVVNANHILFQKSSVWMLGLCPYYS